MISLEHIEVEEYPDSIGSDVRHFRVFDKNGEINRGFGSAYSSEMALYKAMSEYFERLTFAKLRLGVSSNGFAAHIDDEKAKNAAACELVERDAVM
jgi:ribosomal protein S12 methylthiotransferase accessory factor YcaO